MKLIRMKTILELVPFSRTTLWRLERKGNFPKRIRMGDNSVAWDQAEVYEWIEKKKQNRGF